MTVGRCHHATIFSVDNAHDNPSSLAHRPMAKAPVGGTRRGRMEKLNLKTVRGRAKLAGAIFCITGSLIFTFWKVHFVGGLCYFTYDPTSFRKS
ncbi:uncharacterized protein LOC122035093 isoform X2 [Zingiber officinale]|uniref:uncharacterized protein LOC122035093 isoform X2 n=1 Tax=Zingiber officinale TaxID=94328 RepID=UPI001C4A99A7|nr:uncharacterized protein LOC122035093 isoform X2 [Zingiber officinale]